MIVYSILNQHNGKRYIGYTTKGLKARRNKHLWKLRSNTHHNPHLQRAWNRGDRYFLWTILDVCSTIEEVTTAEIKWIAHYNTINDTYGYNLTHGGDGAGIMLPETRAKISKNHVGFSGKKHSSESRDKIRRAKQGKKLSPEHCAVLSACNTGNKHPLFGKKHSPETRRKISAALMGKRRGPYKKSSEQQREITKRRQ